ncbi:peptide chain release factor N(5)-glutamine methyltransferase [[Mycoplasma] mobile]|uniref:peptide chain release factor N(5)-glutamine methyltransferase n=1 Tax=Mycoplasma mobile (strain ATCC 43663 / 163K / NCTC 11711) TaxID=267748 RepID=Q6KIA1_MYCM1|nr:peptide chain release factor N(5)-glutamine methyltransferase [[Mycoplasma] mobile]AAT27675.1 protoporphyrinogen oxidase [Mycoplasma mobile 163K]
MPTIEDLLKEKRRYKLKEEISEKELKMLNLNFPIQKIMGFIEMQNVIVHVNHFVLIPRYETEELILEAYKYLENNNNLDVLDLCSGSGFIALAIKKHFPKINVMASDISEESIRQIQENVAINNLDIFFLKSDLFEKIEKKFDLIVSNPPYLSHKNVLDESVSKYEPHLALFAKKEGFEIIEKIIFSAKKFLKSNGVLLLEIDTDKVKFINKIDFIQVSYLKDINNKTRIAKITYF